MTTYPTSPAQSYDDWQAHVAASAGRPVPEKPEAGNPETPAQPPKELHPLFAGIIGTYFPNLKP